MYVRMCVDKYIYMSVCILVVVVHLLYHNNTIEFNCSVWEDSNNMILYNFNFRNSVAAIKCWCNIKRKWNFIKNVEDKV